MTATLTIELKPEVRRKLVELAERTHQPAATLAAEAVAFYVEQESRTLDGIARGLADLRAGRLVQHEEAMDELDAAISLATKSK